MSWPPPTARSMRERRAKSLRDEAAGSTNPDDYLSIRAFITKYQIEFTKCFGPKHSYGVKAADFFGPDADIHVIARVKGVHQSTKGTTTKFDVPMSKFKVWRKNVKLYTFVSAKKD